MIYLIQQSNDSTVHELAILLLEIARIINCLTRRLVTELPPRFSLLVLALRSCGMWVALTQPCPCHSWHVCKYPLNMKTPVPKLRQAANDNEKEHETANCITYSYAAPPPPRNTPTCSLLAPLWERISSVVVVVVDGGGGGNTLFGSEDDRSLLDSSLDMSAARIRKACRLKVLYFCLNTIHDLPLLKYSYLLLDFWVASCVSHANSGHRLLTCMSPILAREGESRLARLAGATAVE